MKYLLIVVFSLSSLAQARTADQTNSWMSGKTFVQLDEAAKGIFAAGVYEGMIFVDTSTGRPEILRPWMEPCVEGWTPGQLGAVLAKHLNNHPENWNFPAADELVVALRDVCKNAPK